MDPQRSSSHLTLLWAVLSSWLVLALVWGSHVQAKGQLFGTIPTPTSPVTIPPRASTTPILPSPTPQPPGTTPGQPTATPAASAAPSAPPGISTQSPPGKPLLAVSLHVSRVDVLPGESLQFAAVVSNTGAGPASSVLLRIPMAADLELLQVRATQGNASFQEGTLLLDLGLLETDQSALVTLDARVAAAAFPGEVILAQATAYYAASEARSSVVAVALPPDSLPPTGADLRLP